MSETLYSLFLVAQGFFCFWLGWHARGKRDKPHYRRLPFYVPLPKEPTPPPTSHAQRPSHHVSAPTRAPYKVEPSPFIVTPFTPEELEEQTYLFGPFPLPEGWEPPANLLEPIDSQAANKRNRERILANMRAGKRNN